VYPPLVEPVPELDAAAIPRYSRHLILPEVALTGQRRLAAARVLCVGAGGLGSPALLYLAAAGVGTIGVVDADVVDETNLQRQVIHGVSDLGRDKVASARARIAEINPFVNVVAHRTRLDSSNAMEILLGYDLVLDGSDNFATRYLVNDACVLSEIPCVWGSIFRFDGQASVFWAAEPVRGPCYRCLYPEPPPPGLVPSCAEGGVLGVLPGVIGSIQATEAIKIITGIGDPLVGRLLVYDALDMTTRQLRVVRDPQCPVCGDNPTVTELIDYEQFCGLPGVGEESVTDPIAAATITVHQLAKMREQGDDFVLVDVREPYERDIVMIDESVLVPPRLFMDGSAMRELPKDRPVVLYCRSGVRSARALSMLQDAGFGNAMHVDGGVLAWVAEIEPDKPSY
jgi:adenylyltransferase/sulfurtransferase